MSIALKALRRGGAVAPTYVDDVFSTYTYTGNGSTQTITNGINLSTYGGLVWLKQRTGSATSNVLYDTVRGTKNMLSSNAVAGASANYGDVTAFNSNGFSLDGLGLGNATSEKEVSWTFRKAAKFFDCGTFTTGSSTNRRISHSLGVAPGMIIAKQTSGAGGTWYVYHQTQGRGKFLQLESTAAATTLANSWGTADPSTTDFGVDETQLWAAGVTVVWYAFAHDTASDGLIQCGSFTALTAFGTATLTLNWEPQCIWVKRSDAGAAEDWMIFDTMRGLSASDGSLRLAPNLSSAEATYNRFYITATGANAANFTQNATYIYLAIRRPNKPPTSGTQVYNAIARTGTGAAATVTGVGFAPDVAMSFNRAQGYFGMQDRLRGATRNMTTNGDNVPNNGTSAEYTAANSVTAFNQDGISLGSDLTLLAWNNSTNSIINWFWKRAPGCLDVVCYAGNAVVGRNVDHNLGAVPELIVVKNRTDARGWFVYHKDLGNTYGMRLDLSDAKSSGYAKWNSTTPTSTVFTLGGDFDENYTGRNYVALLFATLPGISKVGSYTGNGGTQTINCGFSAGARFVLVKDTTSAGNWHIWDSTRGIVAGNDPYVLLNSTSPEQTATDAIDPDSTGFVINSVNNLNLLNNVYIYLAIA